MCQKTPKDISYEVLIIDNNSNDKTREVVEKFKTKYPGIFRYIFEKNQGLSYARNRGIKEAKGEIVAFTDDDVLVESEWLINIHLTFKEYNVDCVGGKILPVWQKQRPKWLVDKILANLALLDYAEDVFYITKGGKKPLWGANLCVSKRALEELGCFHTIIGRKGNKLYSGEETDFLERLTKKGKTILYQPKLIVHHVIPPSRIQKNYFRKWHFDDGKLKAILLGDYHKKNLLGVPLYIYRQFLRTTINYLASMVQFDKKTFLKELVIFHYLGFIKGRIDVFMQKVASGKI